MSSTISRKCPKCGEISVNKDFCPVCGTMINADLKREMERKEIETQREADIDTADKKNSFTVFLENAKNNDNIFIRFFARFFYTTWVIVLAVGGFLALVFGYIAA